MKWASRAANAATNRQMSQLRGGFSGGAEVRVAVEQSGPSLKEHAFWWRNVGIGGVMPVICEAA